MAGIPMDLADEQHCPRCNTRTQRSLSGDLICTWCGTTLERGDEDEFSDATMRYDLEAPTKRMARP